MKHLPLLLLFLAAQPLLAAAESSPQGPTVPLSTNRAEIVLNGVWLFQPGQAEEKAPSDDWGTIQVPGSWFPKSNTIPGILEQGTGERWKSLGEATTAAWYERTVCIPAEWQNRQIVVDFGRVSTEAQVFLDGKEAGRLTWPGGRIDLTPLARPGTSQKLSLLVTASADAVELDYMGIGQNTAKKAKLVARGIVDDVVLSCFPRGSSIAGIFIQPSVRTKKLKVLVEWAGVPPSAPVAGDIVVRQWPGGEEVRRWNVELPLDAGTSTVELDWPDPKLWDYAQPNLYTLSLRVTGGGVDDEITERFGFREWWIEGRTLFLNGIPFRPQPVNLAGGWQVPAGFGNERAIGALLDLNLSRGAGLGWEWPANFFQRGSLFFQGALARVADEKGFPIFANLVRLNEFANDQDFKFTWPQNKDKWEKLALAEWKKYRNHPAIVGWILSANLGPKYADQNPRNIGQSGWEPSEVTSLQTDVKDLMHKQDPGRSVLFGAATWPGDIYSAMTYLNFIPLQEREEWLSEWASSGTMPYLAIELGTPLQNSYMRGRNHFGPSGETEPWLAEMAAIYLGPDAYKESQSYRRKVRSNYSSGTKFQTFNFDPVMVGDPVYQSIQQLFIRNTWRSWRGLNAGWAGLLSWADDFNLAPSRNDDTVNLLSEFQPGMRGVFPPAVRARLLASSYRDAQAFSLRPGGEELLAQGRPTLAWIAGAPDSPAAKDHNFRAGQSVKKQVAIVNDTRGPLPYEGTWAASRDGQELSRGEIKGTVDAGSSLLVPFEFLIPNGDGGVSEGAIKLSARVGDASSEDAFEFQIFPAVPKPWDLKAPVFVADPVGRTKAWLASLGVAAKPWNGGTSPGAVLVVGREALSADSDKAPAFSALEAFVAAGGRLLIMSQDADWMRQNLGFRVTRHSTRRMWPIRPDHPLMQGLPSSSLRDWAGISTLQEAKPTYQSHEFPAFGWRWGQRGVLGASVIEKPHFTGWRPLFESEFDLQYAPLLELDFGSGRVTWCGLDLEDQAPADPAAERLGRNLLEYVAGAPLIPRVTKTVYVGGEAGAKFLSSLGLIYEQKPALDPSAPLTILASDSVVSPEALWSYVERGGTVFLLGHPQGGVDYFGAKTVLQKNFPGSTVLPSAPEFAGLSLSDLRLKTDVDWRVLAPEGMPGFQVEAEGMLGLRRQGRGRAVWAQLGPDLLQGDKKELPEYLRFTRWRQCRAICQILANLGASFQADARVFRPQVDRISLAGPWQVKVTKPLPLTEWKVKHEDPGISAEATSLVAQNAKLPGEGSETFELPGWYPPFQNQCGEAVWRREVRIPKEWAGKIVQINIPAIKSYDTVFWNGQPVGSTSKDTQKEDPWNLPRKYRVPADLVKAGTNTICIRQFAPDKEGGIHGSALAFNLRVLTGGKQASPLYHPDYREEFETGDEPYRYLRW